MTPGARLQTSVELIESILASWQGEKRIPADKLIENYFKSHRFIGSKDRGAIAELVYWCLRNKATIDWWLTQKLQAPMHGRAVILTAIMLRKDATVSELFAITQDSKYALPKLTAQETARCETIYKACHPAGREASAQDLKKVDPVPRPGLAQDIAMPEAARLNYPEWMSEMLHESFGEDFEIALAALKEQAPTDLRVNTLKTNRDTLLSNLREEGFEAAATTLSPIGIRLKNRAPIFTSKYFKQGHFEVQDEGSQMVALLTDAQPGQRVIDFCAGAGGKTLAIAAAMKNKGKILAWDNSQKRLGQITDRLKRAGVDNVETHVIESESDSFIKRHKQTADRVLVDAPCSGTGTWRRNPDLKWRFTQKDLDEVIAVQQSILQSAARLVKPGGRLIYATCSILKNENERQIEKFLKNVNDFRVVCAQKLWDKNLPEEKSDVSYLWVTPHQDGVDGFFAAVLERLPK